MAVTPQHRGDEDEQNFRITIPFGVEPGANFLVSAGDRLVRVRCPEGGAAGQSLQIRVPRNAPLRCDRPPHATEDRAENCSPGVEPMGTEGGVYRVSVPEGVVGGDRFPVTIRGQEFAVTCPAGAVAGMNVLVRIFHGLDRGDGGGEASAQAAAAAAAAACPVGSSEIFEVTVPEGVSGGQPFTLLAGDRRILVTCPPDALPGQRLRFPLPANLTMQQRRRSWCDASGIVAMRYDDGWVRSIKVVDVESGEFRFQWVRQNGEEGALHSPTDGNIVRRTFDPTKDAYVRKLMWSDEGEQEELGSSRSGSVEIVAASDASMESNVSSEGKEIVGYADLADAQTLRYEDKVKWFHATCDRLRLQWDQGHVRINVRRETMLGDSLSGIMSLSQKDLRKIWRIQFAGEEGIDAGGLTREWYHLITQELFNPENGLWIFSSTNQMCMQINPASGIVMEEHLIYFRFLGRVIGKALFDRQLVAGHMARHFYKLLLGWPMTLHDIKHIDEEIYRNLVNLLEFTPEELECSYLDFTITEDLMGERVIVDLISGGTDVSVNVDNLASFLEANLKYRIAGRVMPQLTEFLLGFHDVIPEPLMTVFDFQELELLMCGLPEIDVDDWKRHSYYTGEFEGTYGLNRWCEWFWDIVRDEFDQEMKARLLQFATGTSGVPSGGFAVLQGNDGRIKKFNIHGVPVEICLYPRAHTCFNRIDLPLTSSKEELAERLKFSVQMASTGFGLE